MVSTGPGCPGAGHTRCGGKANKDRTCIKPDSCKAYGGGGRADGAYSITGGGGGNVYCMLQTKIGGGGWTLAMNVHPNDRHNMAWSAPVNNARMSCGGRYSMPRGRTSFWLADYNHEVKGTAKPFGNDYMSK